MQISIKRESLCPLSSVAIIKIVLTRPFLQDFPRECKRNWLLPEHRTLCQRPDKTDFINWCVVPRKTQRLLTTPRGSQVLAMYTQIWTVLSQYKRELWIDHHPAKPSCLSKIEGSWESDVGPIQIRLSSKNGVEFGHAASPMSFVQAILKRCDYYSAVSSQPTSRLLAPKGHNCELGNY